MLIPLIILSLGALLAGFIPFGEFVSSDKNPLHTSFHLQFSILPVAIGITGILLAVFLYKKQNERPARIAASLGGLYKTVYHKFYIDEIWLFVTKKILFNLVGRPAAWIDKNIVDGMVNLAGNTTTAISERIKKLQSGKVQQYAIYFLAGVIGLAALFIYILK
jgi:NADH-quinone oxidoreductase subunit L